MISKDKRYKTKIGLPVRIYEIFENHAVGAILSTDLKGPVSAIIWNLEGKIWDEDESGNDLVDISQYADLKIDDKVLVWDDFNSIKQRGHFSGVDENGKPTTWYNGQTSFITPHKSIWNHCIKYEENND